MMPSAVPAGRRVSAVVIQLIQFGALFHTEDFIEGRNAEAEGRPPVYRGK